MLRFYFLLFLTITARAQEISATTLLEKSIAYHDPNGQWPSFEGRLVVEMETPTRLLRRTELDISMPKRYFKYKVISSCKVVWDSNKLKLSNTWCNPLEYKKLLKKPWIQLRKPNIQHGAYCVIYQHPLNFDI